MGFPRLLVDCEIPAFQTLKIYFMECGVTRKVTNVIQLLFSDDHTLKIWDTSADLSQPKTSDNQESW